ncbi:DUF2071 domain-containing protein [soil metagenome]
MSQVAETIVQSPARSFLRARWLYLVMQNYVIDPALLLRHVPAGTELDMWNGKTFVSMVGFLFQKTSVLGIPALGYRNFEEVNLRFYVRRRAPEGWRRGVVFVKEIVPKRLIAFIARAVYNEAYVALPMRHSLELPTSQKPGLFRYEWATGKEWNSLEAVVSGEPYLPDQNSEATFITEHYWGYCKQRDGGTVEYQVAHPRWRVWRAEQSKIICDTAKLYGPEFEAALCQQPTSAFAAEGSEVMVRRGRRIAVDYPR